ncbi:MAG: CopD family protein [Candidatus Rokubacteria bacterium]|nr:CopD family protein [Candidatus Rokubacteria bacterium]
MAGFVDVVLRGGMLVFGSLLLGGVAWVRFVLGAEPHAKPDAATTRALRVAAAGAWLGAAAQVLVVVVGLAALGDLHGGWPLGRYLETSFARTALARVALGVALGALAAVLARRPAGRLAWAALAVGAVTLAGSSALLSHAIARVGDRAVLVGLDAIHQVAAGVWVGGLAHLALHGLRARQAADPPARAIARRFSPLALASVAVLVAAGGALTVAYVAEPAALVGTAYGVMVATKIVLLVAALGLACVNFRLVRRAARARDDLKLTRLVEVELGLGLTVLFAAASLTSLPPAVDVRQDRATVAEVAARFTPGPPRLVSPPIDELLLTADPLMAPPGERKPVERAWSEYNHHWAGVFVLLMGVLAALERAGLRAARHWPLAFLGLAAVLFVRNDPRAWPLGPAGFWESMTLPDVLQHRAFVLLVVAFGIFEWMVRTGRLGTRPWAYVFPLLCAAGGGLLLTHSHAMFNLKDEFLTEITHAPLGLLGAFAGWGRWLELRLPEAGRSAGWVWTACLTLVGLLLLFYHEG